MLRSREAAGLAEVSSDAYNSPGGEEQSGAPTAAPLFLTAAGLAEFGQDAYNSQREKSSQSCSQPHLCRSLSPLVGRAIGKLQLVGLYCCSFSFVFV